MEIVVPSLLRIKPDALHKIGKYLRVCGYTDVALILGEGVRDMFSGVMNISLESSEIGVVYEQIASTNNIDDSFETSKKIPQTAKAIVAIGGGKAIDYAKFAGSVTQLPVVSVPTVISNDGFCSPLSSMTVDGRRRTVKTKIPDSVIVDTAIIMKSPEKFLYSGVGDLFCKITSVFDWKLSYKKTGEYVNDFAAVVSKNAVDTFINYRDKNFSNIEYIGIIASSLLMTGLAMEIAGSSRPASGSEHLISHAYDKFSANLSMHGLQVGVASYAVSYLQGATYNMLKSVVVETGFVSFMEKNPLNRKDFISAIHHAQEIKENYYTILSEKESVDKLVDFTENDPLMKKMTV